MSLRHSTKTRIVGCLGRGGTATGQDTKQQDERSVETTRETTTGRGKQRQDERSNNRTREATIG